MQKSYAYELSSKVSYQISENEKDNVHYLAKGI